MQEAEALNLIRGDKLKMNEQAIAQGLHEPRDVRTSTFLRWTRDGKFICVQRDGYKTMGDIYHYKFWERA